MLRITYGEDKVLEVPVGTSYGTMAKMVQPDFMYTILLVESDGKLKELHKQTKKNETIRFITTLDRDGMLTYERSALMLMCAAIHNIAGNKIEKIYVKFSVLNGYYVEIRGNVSANERFAQRVKEEMRHLVNLDLPLVKKNVPVDVARQYFLENGMPSRERLFRYRRHSGVNLYSIGDYVDYYYGYMVPSTGYIKYFDLIAYESGLALLLPDKYHPEEVFPIQPKKKTFDTLQDASDWSEAMDIATVGEINDKIAKGQIRDIILMAEARQEKDIAAIAQTIAEDPNKKCVMIAGPSSSGKTSFSHRLSVQLRGLGLQPHPIEVDNYFVDREFTPRDENGEYDFESIDGVDIKQFNEDMLALLRGEEVAMPTFNFKTGHREYKGNTLQIRENDILVIEGIHCLNDRMSELIPPENKYRIFISALTQTNIDEHNRIPSSDGRLLRRMVRDARTRGYSAQETLARWDSVRRGETRNIVPFQEEADAVFNSSLVYEFSVLKSYAEQLLFGIPEDAPEHPEAVRLLKFLDYFLSVDSTLVPQNSLLKEFIGGSVFGV
ncbi:MAG: nucleoside kinase [Lachnospiraceae bacterium]|nr:nucleoside kinase [Lachnospiraceae bacterium]